MNPICHRCNHYYITWEKAYPHGCRAMKFKSRRLPCLEVRHAMQGRNCLAYTPKIRINRQKNATRQRA
jgi:hypothetical protein